jgi:hypothetical protein
MAIVLNALREFLLYTYHSLPNVIIFSLVFFGLAFAELPFLVLAAGLILNAGFIMIAQSFINGILQSPSSQTHAAYNNVACSIYPTIPNLLKGQESQVKVIAPSYWIGALTFFLAYVLTNSVYFLNAQQSPAASQEQIDATKVQNILIITMVCITSVLIIARLISGCETKVSGLSAIILSAGLGVAYWQLIYMSSGGEKTAMMDVLGITRRKQPIIDCSDPNQKTLCAPKET